MATEVNGKLSANLKIVWMCHELTVRCNAELKQLLLQERAFICARNNDYHSSKKMNEAFH